MRNDWKLPEAPAHEAGEGLVFLMGLETPGESLLADDADKEKITM